MYKRKTIESLCFFLFKPRDADNKTLHVQYNYQYSAV